MREAKAQDYWRALARQSDAYELTSVTFQDVQNIGKGTLDLSGQRLNVICGQNGVGKSTFLEGIHRAALGLSENSPSERLSNGSVRISIRNVVNDGFVTFDSDGALVTGGPVPVRSVLVEPSREAAEFRTRFSIEGIRELIQGNGSRDYSADSVSEISGLVGRSYRQVSVTEVADIVDDKGNEQGPWPHFTVAGDYAAYSSEHMGFGELAILHLYWRLEAINAPTLMLIEEPDAHVPPTSQRAVLRYIVKRCVETKSACVVTGHSPVLIQAVPTQARLLCGRSGRSFTVIRAPSRAQLAPAVGVSTQGTVVVLVEDETALRIALILLRDVLSQWDRDIEFRVAGSEARVAESICGLARFQSSSVRIVGLFDGDVRTRSEGIAKRAQWPMTFLPGVEAPEIVLRRLAGAAADRFAVNLNIDRRSAEIALDAHQASDHHEWASAIGKMIGRSWEEVVDAAARIWSSDERFREEIDVLAKVLEEVANGA